MDKVKINRAAAFTSVEIGTYAPLIFAANAISLDYAPEELKANINAEQVNDIEATPNAAGLGMLTSLRQSFIHQDAFVGPVEQVTTLAPNESLEVAFFQSSVYVKEKEVTQNTERTSTNERTNKESSDLSKKISNSISENSSTSQRLGGSYGEKSVFSVEASSESTINKTTQSASEFASRELREITRRATDEEKSTLTIKTRVSETSTSTNTTTRKITNTTSNFLSYGIRRLYRQLAIQTRDMGAQLSFQIAVQNPGKYLRVGKTLHHPILDLPTVDEERLHQQTFVKAVDSINGAPPTFNGFVSIDIGDLTPESISGLHIVSFEARVQAEINPVGQNKISVSVCCGETEARFNIPTESSSKSSGYVFELKNTENGIRLLFSNTGVYWNAEEDRSFQRGYTSLGASITYKLIYKPGSRQLLERNGDQYVNEMDLRIQRERSVSVRPGLDLRGEERQAIFNAIKEVLPAKPSGNESKSVAEAKFFDQSYFDFEAMFYLIPSSDSAAPNGNWTDTYFVTPNSNSAKFGESLGWNMQHDGDDRRNAFLNASRAIAVIPIRKGLHKKALDYLDENKLICMSADKKSSLINQLDWYWEAEKYWASRLGEGCENETPQISADGDFRKWLSGSSNVDFKKWDAKTAYENLYPVVARSIAALPVEGFVYDQIQITD